jgi:hypothetical protein
MTERPDAIIFQGFLLQILPESGYHLISILFAKAGKKFPLYRIAVISKHGSVADIGQLSYSLAQPVNFSYADCVTVFSFL